MTTTQQDDFLAQVLGAETQATQIVDKAQNQARLEQRKKEKELEQGRAKVLTVNTEKAKILLQERQVGAKQLYEKVTKEGEGEAKLLKKEAEKKEESLLLAAEAVFLNDII